MSKIPYFFLLGGRDLEMITIRALLEQYGYDYGQDFLDKELEWGASWEDYASEVIELSKDTKKVIVGIELSHKDKKPKNAIDIDHHNDRSAEKSSIEQVANLLNHTLSRKEQLIAANDRDYIPGMEKMDATPEEIDEIRIADRQAQGVTQNDEDLATKSIEKGGHHMDTLVIHSLSEKFSPIVDRLYGKADKLLVLTASQLTYYGPKIDLLAKKYDDLISADKAYHGGGHTGFFGIAKSAFSNSDLVGIKDEIIDMVSEAYSKHIFLFPFSWKINGETTDINGVDKLFDSDENWKREKYSVKDTATYNESVYFYDFTKKAIYDYGEKDDLFRHYEYQLVKGATYSIYIKGEDNPIVLDLTDILLNIYTTGVGVLSFHLDNKRIEQSLFDKVLKINEFGRRVFPQFLDNKSGIKGPQGAFLAEKIILNTGKEEIVDGLSDAYPPVTGYSNNIKLSKVILDILPEGLNSNDNIKPILDDRMFVICWYGNDDIINEVSQFEQSEHRYKYTQSDDWYRLLFVDKGDLTVQNRQMQKELIEKHSYARWIEQQQFFGITRYSFIALTKQSKPWLIPDHVTTIYYKMIELALVQRISALHFAEKATSIAKLKGNPEEISNKVSSLFKEYIEFQNRIYFREVTAQEQGIEMYNMMQDLLRTERDVKELDKELDELNQYANMLEEARQTKIANKQAILANSFAKLAAIFIPATIITGILGMNTVPPDWQLTGSPADVYWPFWFSLVFIFFISFISFLAYRYWKNKLKNNG